MDAIKQQLLRIQQQLTGLSASQKMLTASLVVIMIMTMFYWSRYAGTAEMAPLLDQQLSPEEIAQMKTALAAKGVSYTVTGDKIMVPADKKFELIADLGYAQLLPNNIKDGFNDIILKNDNPFNSGPKTEQLWNHAKEVNLSQIIGRWPGVKSATVIIDGTKARNPGRSIQPTAAVAIWMKSGEGANRKLVDASADLIAGAQAGLPRANVKVTINGQSFKIRDTESGNAFDGGENSILEQKAREEQRQSEKILALLGYIPGIYATVTVDLKTQTSWMNEKTVDPKGKVEAVKKSITTSEENSTSTPSGEPGMAANTGLSANDPSGGGGGQNSISEKTEVENVVDTSVKHVTTQMPAGDALAVAAAVRVPLSYFTGVWKAENPSDTKGPSAEEIEAIVTREAPHIRAAVRSATNIKEDTAISVAKYIDITQPLNGSEASTTGLASLPTGFGFGAKEIAIGALAIISLFMVSMMVRKSVPQPVLATVDTSPAEALAMPAVAVDQTAELGEGGVMMTGHELTDDVIEAKQVIEQVGTMVQENPDVAANLIKRWLNRE